MKADFQRRYLKEIGVVTPIEPVLEDRESSPSLSLEELARRAKECKACALAEGRNNVVFGCGNPNADLVFIGEAPGKEEDLQGLPFVGRAGKLLDQMLAAIHLDRKQVYIMNVVKCRPPNNRDPKPEEVEACRRWFEPQIRTIAPKLICVLGRIAAHYTLGTQAPLSSLRGKWHSFEGIPVWVTYHPAYLLRNPEQKRRAWEDFRTLMRRYKELR